MFLFFDFFCNTLEVSKKIKRVWQILCKYHVKLDPTRWATSYVLKTGSGIVEVVCKLGAVCYILALLFCSQRPQSKVTYSWLTCTQPIKAASAWNVLPVKNTIFPLVLVKKSIICFTCYSSFHYRQHFSSSWCHVQ